MIVYSDYENPNFLCSADANNHGLVNTNIGLLTYDEVLHAGGYPDRVNDSYYLDKYNGDCSWYTMSPAGIRNTDYTPNYAYVWGVYNSGRLTDYDLYNNRILFPVINLKADVTVIGEGTADSHWLVQ